MNKEECTDYELEKTQNLVVDYRMLLDKMQELEQGSDE